MEAKFDPAVTIQSQYSASPRIKALVDGFAGLIDPSPDISLLFSSYIDIDTATGAGLDNWGRIVGLERVQNNFTLDDPTYRTFLKVKATANISGVTLYDLNVILNVIFGVRGGCYVIEAGLMQIRYIFNFELTPVEKFLLKSDAILPRPGCVAPVQIYFPGDESYNFGFDGQNMSNFDNGSFPYVEIPEPPQPGEEDDMIIGAIASVPYQLLEMKEGWCPCDGRSLPKLGYPDLWAVLGETYGPGSTQDTFRIPDFRGYFLRGAGGAAGAIGTPQADAIRNIAGKFSITATGVALNCSPLEQLGAFAAQHEAGNITTGIPGGGVMRGFRDIGFDASRMVPTASENRPVNYAVTYLIWTGVK